MIPARPSLATLAGLLKDFWNSPCVRIFAGGLVAGMVLLELAGLSLAYRAGSPGVTDPATREPKSAKEWQAANERLAQKIAAQRPTAEYLVIDTARNRVTLRKGDTIEIV